MSWCSDAPEDEAISLFAGLLANPDMTLSLGWRDFPLDKDDTWEPITNLPGSEHMIAKFQRNWEEEYKIKTSGQLQSVLDNRWRPRR
jgi:hypothetical protein